MRGADLLVSTLKAAGVDRIFGLSGNQIMPIFDACMDAGIAITHTRHEAAAVFMAEAYAQLTGKIGVALVTAGGGLANTPGALLSASASETPLLLLSGDSPVGQDGKGAFQEMDQPAITRAVTKNSDRVLSVQDLGRMTAEAISKALSDRPGPVHLSLPFDVLNADADAIDVPEGDWSSPKQKEASEQSLGTLAEQLIHSQKPLILLGPRLNATRAPGLQEKLGIATGAPVLAMESPRGLNDPSLGRLRDAVEAADLIVTLGKKIDFTTGFGAGNAGWIVVDSDTDELERAKRNLADRLIAGVNSDPGQMAKALLRAAVHQERAGWQEDVAGLTLPISPLSPAENGAISSIDLCQAIADSVASAKYPIFISDGGEIGQGAQALVRCGRRVINGVSGAIGGGLPYAAGAKTGFPDAQVIALSGDGSIGFHLAEFETAVREKLPFVVIVGNDQRWNAEYQIQLRNYGAARLHGCELGAARYDLVAKALGGHGEYVSTTADLTPAIARAINSGKPACVNVLIEGLPAPSAH